MVIYANVYVTLQIVIMKSFQKIIFLSCFLFALQTNLCAQKKGKMKVIDIYKQYITGNFNNSNQVVAEIAAGKQIHPLAIHINRVCDDKIVNKPTVNGFFILEESYYLYEGKTVEAKPYLFLFEAAGDSAVKLTVYQWPKELKKEACRNDNADLKLDFTTLVPSTTFKGALYVWQAKEKTFSTNSVNDLPNGMRFTLTEKFNDKQLQVMELLEKDGKRLTTYDTPIVYDRK
jgi:hypothetical protein